MSTDVCLWMYVHVTRACFQRKKTIITTVHRWVVRSVKSSYVCSAINSNEEVSCRYVTFFVSFIIMANMYLKYTLHCYLIFINVALKLEVM